MATNPNFMRIPPREREYVLRDKDCTDIEGIMIDRIFPDWEMPRLESEYALLRHFRTGALADCKLTFIHNVITEVSFVEGLDALERNEPSPRWRTYADGAEKRLAPRMTLDQVQKALELDWPNFFGDVADERGVTAYYYLARPSMVLAVRCDLDHRVESWTEWIEPKAAAQRLRPLAS
ncbi:MAG: hypothetical protein KC609_17695 [Myxococcales bacterium]|nr:hypothetical protein [Myxococcales bacterium]